MASRGGKEHRMLFDIRGRRKTAVKVVYAILAVLMGASLFLVVGPLNIGEIFNNESGGGGEAAKPFEEQAERLQVKLKKDPEDPDLLLSLTRAQVNAGNAQITVEPSGKQVMTLGALQSFQAASQTWSEYVDATKEPSSGLALLMAPALLRLAELSRSLPEAQSNIEAATEAQRIVAAKRPSLNAYSTLALYTTFTGEYAAAEKAEQKAKTYANEKFQREALEKQLDEAKERAEKFQTELKKAEEQGKAKAKAGGKEANPESLENPQSGLSGAFGGGLGE
jgi:hypothetical protein